MNNIVFELSINLIYLIIGVFFLFYIKSRKGFDLANITVVLYLLNYGLSGFYTFLSGRVYQYESKEIIILAYSTVLVFCLGLILVNVVLKRKYLVVKRQKQLFEALLKSYFRIPKKIIYTLWVISFIGTFFVKHFFGLGYYGSGTAAKALAIPYAVLIASSMLLILYTGIVFGEMIRIFFNRREISIFTVLIITIHIITNFTYRRELFFIIVVPIIFLYAIKKTFSIKRIIGFSTMLILVAFFIFPYSMGYREIQREIANRNPNITFLKLTLSTFSIVKDYDLYELKKLNKQNVKDRSYILSYSYDFIKRAKTNPMNGKLLAAGFWGSVPRILSPSKGIVVSETPIIDFYNAYEYGDMADNLPLYGYIDFKLLGSFISGFILGIIFFLIEIITLRAKFDILRFSYFITGLILGLNVENTYLGWFSIFRNLLLLFILSELVFFFYYSNNSKNAKNFIRR